MVNPGDGSGNTGGVVDTPNGGGDDSNDENTDSGNDSGNDNTGDDDDTSDMKYDSKSFVGFWEITIVDWDDTYYLKLDDAGNYYESIESDGDFSNAGKYIVSGNVFSIPKGSGVSNGYGTNFVIESVSDDYIFMHCDDINTYKIVMKRLPESDEGGDDNEESVGGFSETINGLVVTWAADVTAEQKEILTSLVQNMVSVSGGTFMMGANLGDTEARDNEKPRHSVTLSGYRIGKYEVTQKEWLAVMGSNPSWFKGDNLPVEKVSWNDCQAFVQKLNNMTGLSFRLPTEAEWEFAARGGNRSIGYKYSGGDNIGSVAWYDGNSGSTTHPVGQKQGNELGLYDMSGNVWEWCSDWYDSSYYSSSPSTNPKGPSSGSSRVYRGGCWDGDAGGCRVSIRSGRTPSRAYDYLGVRLALSVDDSGNDEQGGDIDDSIVYDESDFVGVWEATVVDWGDIYYLKFDEFGNYYETYSKDTDFSLSGQYSVSDNVLSIPYGCGVANGYGTDYIIESVTENSITLKSCDFEDDVIMQRLSEDEVGSNDNIDEELTITWSSDVTTEQKEILTSLVQNMVSVSGGTFMMGANSGDSEADNDEKPSHSVTLSGYRIGKYEVTQREWLAVMGSNPSWFKGDNLPVEKVSWNDCQAFIQKLNSLTGLSFRLPTEAEWEYAARGGNRSIGYKYSGGDNIGSVAWYDGNSGNTTHPVGQKQGNELGLYDMSGNVDEWCSDWYDSSYYSSSPSTNPKGPSSDSSRVRRGGSWDGDARNCRVSNRYSSFPAGTNPSLGLRLALQLIRS